MRLLVTRPEPDGQRTAALLRARGHDVLVVPMLRIEAIARPQLGVGPWGAVLFTSANAVRAVSTHDAFRALAGALLKLPAYVVGARTRAGAVAAGFSPVISADGNADDLAALVAAQSPRGDLPLLHVAGSDVAGDLAGALQAHGLRVETAIVYRSVMVADLRPDARAALTAGEVDAVLHYSARSATAFLHAAVAAGIGDLVLSVRHLCLSPQVAAPLVEAGARAVVVAQAPNEDALFARIGGT
jgi:uroporphyrinogen-III synthase